MSRSEKTQTTLLRNAASFSATAASVAVTDLARYGVPIG